MATPFLGWISPRVRNQQQHAAHARSLVKTRRFVLPYRTPPKGTKIILNDFFKREEVIKDMGMFFTGFHQNTGSCVGVSWGDWVACQSAVQRYIADKPTKAFIPWWGFNYGRSRFYIGDRTPGDGSIDSAIGDVTEKEGYLSINEPNLKIPTFDTSDGLAISSSLEYAWSDGDSSLVMGCMVAAKKHLGARAPLYSTDDIFTSIINGYCTINGDNRYVGHGSIKGSGDNAICVGHYDGQGGHSTCYSAYWNHPDFGEHAGYWNQWSGSTYPKDPGGLHRCMVWVPRANIDTHFTSAGDGGNGETMALSHLDWDAADPFPPQPKILDCFM